MLVVGLKMNVEGTLLIDVYHASSSPKFESGFNSSIITIDFVCFRLLVKTLNLIRIMTNLLSDEPHFI